MSRSNRSLALQLFLLLLATAILQVVATKLESAISPSPNSRNKKNADFLRHLQGKQLGNCEGDCDTDADCADSRVCYHRKSNTNVPRCCQNRGLSTKDSTDYCVSAGCAAYTDDVIVDDDPFSGLDDDFWDNVVQDDNFDGLGVCQGSCHDDDDCFNSLVCFRREKGDPIPKCCENSDISTTVSTNFCAPENCAESSDSSGLAGLCFSGETLVEISGSEHARMSDLMVGDKVMTGAGNYQPVYAFAHIDRTRTTAFLQFHVSSAPYSTLELTTDHMLFIDGKADPVRAGSIRVGDILHSIGSTNDSPRIVTGINYITRVGLFAPLTQDGTIVTANGIVASNYITVQRQKASQYTNTSTLNKSPGSEYVELPWLGKIPLTEADAVHMWLSPLRLVCMGRTLAHQYNQDTALTTLPTTVTSLLCQSHGTDGMLPYVSFGLELVHFIEKHHLLVQLLVLLPSLLILSISMAVEYMFSAFGGSFISLLAFATSTVFSVWWLRSSTKQHKKKQPGAA